MLFGCVGLPIARSILIEKSEKVFFTELPIPHREKIKSDAKFILEIFFGHIELYKLYTLNPKIEKRKNALIFLSSFFFPFFSSFVMCVCLYFLKLSFSLSFLFRVVVESSGG